MFRMQCLSPHLRDAMACVSKLAMRGQRFDLALGVRPFASHSQHLRDIFSPNTAEFVAAAGSVSSIPPSMRLPEVVITGRANVGKSTLLNAVMKRRRLVASSKKPGRTKTLTFFRVGPNPGNVILVDAPGYGDRGRAEWGQLFDHYLKTRQELCRVYVLLNAKHGLNEADRLMLQDLDDKIQSGQDTAIEGIKRAIFENAPTCLPPIVTSSLKSDGLGVNDVRRSIVEACGIARSHR